VPLAVVDGATTAPVCPEGVASPITAGHAAGTVEGSALAIPAEVAVVDGIALPASLSLPSELAIARNRRLRFGWGASLAGGEV